MATKETPPAIKALRIFAWINLIGGIFGAIIIWYTFGTVEHLLYSTSITESNPYTIFIGFVSLFEGALICAFCLVICLIAEYLLAIRDNTEYSLWIHNQQLKEGKKGNNFTTFDSGLLESDTIINNSSKLPLARCNKCGKQYPIEFSGKTCEECGGSIY
jgi:hypothetical protein